MPFLTNGPVEDSKAIGRDGQLVAPGKKYVEPAFIDCTISGTNKVTISPLGDEIVSKKLKGFREYTHVDYYGQKEN